MRKCRLPPFDVQLEGGVRSSQSITSDASDDDSGEEGDDYYDDEDAFADVEASPESLDVGHGEWQGGRVNEQRIRSRAVAPQCMNPTVSTCNVDAGALQGEPLLCSAYLAGIDEAQEQAQLLRSSMAAASPRIRGPMGSHAAVAESYAYTSFATTNGGEVDESVAMFDVCGGGGGKVQAGRGAATSHAYSSAAALRLDDSVLTGSVAYSSIAAPPWARGPMAGGSANVAASGARGSVAIGALGLMPLTRPITPSQLGSSFGHSDAAGRASLHHQAGGGHQHRGDGKRGSGAALHPSPAPLRISAHAMAEAAANKLRSRRILAGEEPEPDEAGSAALEGEFMGAFLVKREIPRSPVAVGRSGAKAGARANGTSGARVAGSSSKVTGAASRAAPATKKAGTGR